MVLAHKPHHLQHLNYQLTLKIMILTDFKSSPFPVYNTGNLGNANYSGTATALYNGYTGTGLNGIPDTSLDTLVGSKWSTDAGQTLTLVSNAAVALVGGVLVQNAAEVTAFEKMAITVPTATPATAGTYQVLVTNGATQMNINQFAGGQLIVASATGIGQTLTIASHTAAAATGKITVTLVDPIQTTLDATSTVSFVYPNGKNVIIMPTTPTGLAVGVTVYPIPASVANVYNGATGALTTAGTPQYGFVVSHGPVGCLIDSSVTNVGYPLGQKCATAGCLGIATLTTSPQIAISMQTLTSGQVGAVYMLL
jgi:hypothetical protein